jgi:hypothetical protein
MRVFAWDANPSIDRFAFKQSEMRATELVRSGRGYFVTPPDGYPAVQLSPPAEIGLERLLEKPWRFPYESSTSCNTRRGSTTQCRPSVITANAGVSGSYQGPTVNRF